MTDSVHSVVQLSVRGARTDKDYDIVSCFCGGKIGKVSAIYAVGPFSVGQVSNKREH